ncbi:MAG: metallophosphoesterase [Clostridia bacterium]|nr:metallophosphoesterase [Clostridia bacterium]
MKFAVLSDTHYISRSTLYGEGSPRDVLRHDINVAVFDALEKRTDIDTVLITGDLTDAGDLDSHREFIVLLQKLKASGKNVYVLTATHDFHFSRAWVSMYDFPVRYRERPWETPWFDREGTDYKSLVTEEFADLPAADCVPQLKQVAFPDDLWEMYREFGRAQAFSACDSAYSYAVKLEDKLWCLMLNNNMRDVDALFDFSAAYSPACYRWIEGIVRQAKAEGAFVFACTHHPLVPPSPGYKIGGTTRNMRNSRICHTLADIGLSLVFSGHTHFADVAFGESDAGRVLCNVTTPSICFYPPAWRLAELDPAEHRLKLTAVPVEKTDAMQVGEETLRAHFAEEFIAEWRRKMAGLPHGLGNIVLRLELGHLYPLVRRASGLTKAEFEPVRHRRLFDLMMDLTLNMQAGDGRYTPDTPEYRFMMGLAAVADSVIAAQPFIPIEKKLQGYTVSQIIEPLLYNNGVPDNDADFVFDRLPEDRFTPPHLSSRAGDAIMIVLSIAAALLSPLSPLAAAAAIPVMTLRKKRRPPLRPERY